MVDVRHPVAVVSDDDGRTSPQPSAGTGTDVRAAARVLEFGNDDATAAHRRYSAQVMVGGGLLVAFLVVLVVSVIWVADDSKHPVVQPNPPPSTTVAPTPGPTVAVRPTPLPATTSAQAPPVDAAAVPTETMSPSQVTAETITPAPPLRPRHRWLRELFPNLFPGG